MLILYQTCIIYCINKYYLKLLFIVNYNYFESSKMADIKPLYSNFFIYYKLAQSGKTTIIQDSIHKDEEKILEKKFFDAPEILDETEILDVLDLTSERDKIIYANIIITANNLILTNQTYERLSEFMKGKIFEMSSKKSSFTDIVLNIAKHGKDGLPICRNIICCSNKVQFNNISEIIESFLSQKIKVNIYCDEIDKYWTQIKSIIEKYPDAIFYGLTATINKKMFDDQGGSMLFIHQDICHGSDYVGYRDHEIITIQKQNNIETVEKILDEIEDENANILIIPGRTNEEHRDIAETCLLLGALPIIINQRGIIMYKNKGKRGSVDLKMIYKNKELCDILKNIRNDYNITNPIVVIGSSVCAGRGVTHQSEDFIYDYGIILQNPTNKIEIYQSVSRLAHNFKYLNKKCKVYITESNDKIARECEDRIYKINEMSGDHPVITYKEFENAGKEKYKHSIIEFETQEAAKKYCIGNENNINNRGPVNRKLNNEGYYEATIKKITKVWTRAEIDSNIFIGSSNNKYRLYPCYHKIEDKSSLRWLLVIRK